MKELTLTTLLQAAGGTVPGCALWFVREEREFSVEELDGFDLEPDGVSAGYGDLYLRSGESLRTDLSEDEIRERIAAASR